MHQRSETAREVAVLFVDISDSSGLFRRLGDLRATGIVERVLSAMEGEVSAAGGRILDRIGDEVLAAFPSALSAVRAAVAQQLHTLELRGELPPEVGPLSVRCGIHYGRMEHSGGRPVGSGVYLAKRIVEAAKAEQILTCGETLESVGSLEFPYRRLERTVLRGQDRAVTLVEVLWNEPEATNLIAAPVVERAPVLLSLRHSGATYLLECGGHLRLGRAASCDVVITTTGVSRLHAIISERRRRFYLRDSSTNGTYLRRARDGTDVHLYRDEIALSEAGRFALGMPLSHGGEHTLEYRCLRKRDEA